MVSPLHVRRLAFARFLSLAGNDAVFSVGLLCGAVYDFDAGPAQVAPLMLSIGVSFLVGSAVGGPLVDRFDPRRVRLVGELCAAPVALAMILPSTLAGLTAITAVLGLLYGIVHVGSASLDPFLVEEAERTGGVNASLGMAEGLGAVAGAAVAALLSGTVGTAGVFVLDAATSIVAALLVVGVSLRPVRRDQGLRAAELAAGLRLIGLTPVLRYAVALGLATFLSWGFFAVFEPLFFRDALHEGVAVFGVVNAVFGAGVVAGAIVARRLLANGATLRLVTVLVAASGAGAVAYTGIADIRAVVVGSLLFGTSVGVLEPAIRTAVQAATPDALVGRVTGVLGMTESAGDLVPPLIVGGLAVSADPQAVLVGAGMVLTAVAVAALPLAVRLDRPTLAQRTG